MASFPDLRTDRGSAQAERRVARSFRHLAVLLAALTALFVVAFLAVSELATPGAKALVRTSALVTHLVREPTAGIGIVPGASA